VAVAGVDACAGRWVAVVLDGAGHFVGAELRAGIAELADALAALAGEHRDSLDVLGIDIPIGLPTAGYRAADLAVRSDLGRRRSSLFLTPTRAALQEPDYARANAINRELTGAGMSRQAHGLRDRILDVDAWLTNEPRPRVVEVHPETSFRHLTGAPMPHSKKTWAGMNQRRAALAGAGIEIPADVGAAGAYGAVDDVLDAAAAAWSASRVLRGEAQRYPSAQVAGETGEPAIWA